MSQFSLIHLPSSKFAMVGSNPLDGELAFPRGHRTDASFPGQLTCSPVCYSMPELEKSNKTFTTYKALLLSPAFLPVLLLYLLL